MRFGTESLYFGTRSRLPLGGRSVHVITIYKLMINNCPNCGFSLQQELNDGISHCKNCNAVFNSNVFNEILSAAWQLRRQNISLDKLEWQTKLDKDLVNFVYYFVSILGYSHDELLKMLKKFQNN